MDQTLARLVAYAEALQFEDLPEEVVHQVKRLVLDSLGCGIGAFTSEPVKGMRALAATVTGDFSATVLGTTTRTTADLAALANGTMVRYLDFNDSYNGKDTAHPSDNIPCVLAAAEASFASGRDLITGIALAYEVQAAWVDTFGMRATTPFDQAAYGAISMPLGAAKVMGLEGEELTNALSISMVGGMGLGEARAGEISHWKGAAMANAGRNAIVAAQLAERGVTGPPAIFEGSAGFYAGVTRTPQTLEPLAGEGGNGRAFRLLDSRFKRYPSGFFSQTAIEGALEARTALEISGGGDVKRVHLGTFSSAVRVMGSDPTRWRPQTRETADHSLPYVIACALQYGSLEPSHFDEEMLGRPELVDLMQKVQVEQSQEAEEAWPEAILNILTVERQDGRSYTARVPYYQGHYKRPMSDGDLEDKFRGVTRGLLNTRQQDAVIEAVWALDEIDDLTLDLMALLAI